MPGGTAVSAPIGASDPELRAGTVVGDFLIERTLGKGAFGTVYKGAQPLSGKDVAIKVLAHKHCVDDEVVERFIAEARAVNQIGHKHIIDIFSFGVLDDGRHYYVMEHMAGETLDAILDRGRLTLAEALPILRPIARALDAAHAKGIAHRDLKPENVFVGRDEDGAVFPKLLDFGIAKLLGPDDGMRHKTRTGAPIGTPYYMSPEQCRGRNVDHRTDYYAFGVMTYQLLTGAYPIEAEDYMSVLLAQINETPEPPSSKVPELTEATDEAVLWLMQKDPAARPPSLAAAVDALERASMHGAPIGVPRISVEQPIATRNRAPLFALAAAGVLALGAVAFFALRPSRATPPAPVVAPAPPPVLRPVPPPTPPPRLVAPVKVTITIDGPPNGTRVRVAGDVIGNAPGPIVLDRGAQPIVLTFEATDHQPASQSVVPDDDKQVTITLKRVVKRTSLPNRDPNLAYPEFKQ